MGEKADFSDIGFAVNGKWDPFALVTYFRDTCYQARLVSYKMGSCVLGPSSSHPLNHSQFLPYDCPHLPIVESFWLEETFKINESNHFHETCRWEVLLDQEMLGPWSFWTRSCRTSLVLPVQSFGAEWWCLQLDAIHSRETEKGELFLPSAVWKHQQGLISPFLGFLFFLIILQLD